MSDDNISSVVGVLTELKVQQGVLVERIDNALENQKDCRTQCKEYRKDICTNIGELQHKAQECENKFDKAEARGTGWLDIAKFVVAAVGLVFTLKKLGLL